MLEVVFGPSPVRCMEKFHLRGPSYEIVSIADRFASGEICDRVPE